MGRAQHIEGFADAIWEWYSAHKRILPWRDLETSDASQKAYEVYVSEVMLQQTQVPRVEIIFPQFLKQFPDLNTLAKASNREVLVAWRGMGYNSRALRMRDAAKVIVEELNGAFPNKIEELISIKGIGEYTAAAILNFAFNEPTPCIDTNIRRILHRSFVGPEKEDGTWEHSDQELLKLAKEVLDCAIDESAQHDARNWHAALMDYGSLVQTKTNPKWEDCILTKRGLMRAAYKVPVVTKKKSKEPGRNMEGKFVPNRIFRGRVIEKLRDHPEGLPLDAIGKAICSDWSEKKHQKWLQEIVEKLQSEKLLSVSGKKYALRG